MKSYLIKKAEKTRNFGENFELFQNSNVLRHNFFCRAAILIWKVALESLYKHISNAINEIKIRTTGAEDIRQINYVPLSYKIHNCPFKNNYLIICFSSH